MTKWAVLLALGAMGVGWGQEARVEGGGIRVAGKGVVEVWVAGVAEAPPVLGNSRAEGGKPYLHRASRWRRG